jgi:hypothetical protein
MQVLKSMSQFYKIGLQLHESKTSIKLLYFQVDKNLMCMDIISTFHTIIIIYQSFNVEIFWKIWTTNQFKTYFSSIFLL